MDDIKAYEYIKEILDKGTISEAADSLYVSQPSLSQYIIRLEEEIGEKILIRKAKPVKLTDFGEVFYEKLKKIYLIKKSIKTSIEEVNLLKKGKVTIGSLNYHSVCILANVLPEFREKYPNVEINIVDGTLLELENLAAEGKTDFSILMIPFKSQKLDYDLLMNEDILIAINSNSKIALNLYNNNKSYNRFPVIDLHELKDEYFIILTKEKRLRRTFEEAVNLMTNQPKVLMETNDITNAIILASTGMGITFCTSVFANNYKNQMPIKFLSPKQKLTVRPIVAAYNSDYPLSKASQVFLNMLKDYCNNKM